MKCIKCRKEIPEGSLFCNHCGKKQSATKSKTHKRAHGTGTIKIDRRYHKPYLAYAPASKALRTRKYIGAYQTRKEAQEALEQFVREGCPLLYGATLETIYKLWSDVHFDRVSEHARKLYTSMWKRFEPLYKTKFADIRTPHWQSVINTGTSKSACETLKAMAMMLSKYAMENDVVSKNYAEFVKLPKFEKKEKKIFSKEDLAKLWRCSDDRNVQLVLFMIYTGLRIGEAASIRCEDVHLKEGYIIGGEKTEAGRNRIIPLPSSIPEISAFVENWMKEATDTYLLGVQSNAIRERFNEALKTAGIEGKFTPHCTRHTFASLCSAAGMKPENLQKIIGHSNFHTTAEIYIHQDLETLSGEMGKLSK